MFSLSSFAGVLLFLVVSNNPDIPYIDVSKYTGNFAHILKYSIAALVVIVFAKFVLHLSRKFLEKADNVTVEKIKPAEGIYLPIYIGLFVIALSFSGGMGLEAVFLIFFLFLLWIRFENVSYFNPFLLFWGYRFYEVETRKGISIMVITKKKDLKSIEVFKNLIRINNFTFLEI